VVIAQPSFGTIVKSGVGAVLTFTQQDISSGLIAYQQNRGSAPSDGFTFEVFDPAGNNSGVVPFGLQIAAPSPVPNTPVVTARLLNDTGLTPSDGVTSDDTLTGTADPGATVTITEAADSTVLGTDAADSSGAWTFAPSELAQGYHMVRASETNAEDETGSTLLSFDYDTVTPSTPGVPQLSSGGDTSLVNPYALGVCVRLLPMMWNLSVMREASWSALWWIVSKKWLMAALKAAKVGW
jgi:hypothetical protein